MEPNICLLPKTIFLTLKLHIQWNVYFFNNSGPYFAIMTLVEHFHLLGSEFTEITGGTYTNISEIFQISVPLVFIKAQWRAKFVLTPIRLSLLRVVISGEGGGPIFDPPFIFQELTININPIQDGAGKKAPYQFFLCNLYKRRNWPLKLSDF